MKQMYLSIRENVTALLPDPSRVHEVPGPRWYMPWSPQIVLKGEGRSYRFGEDGRFREDGYLRCRLAGHNVSALAFGNAEALGRDMLKTSGRLAKREGLPGDARAVVEEAALMDPDTSTQFKDAINNLFKTYDPAHFNLSQDDVKGFLSVIRTGEMPSPIAIQPWVDRGICCFWMPTTRSLLILRSTPVGRSRKSKWNSHKGRRRPPILFCRSRNGAV
jgi:hypothetical protein